ncbi:VanW family protein [Amycolatopsis sp. BJA-103]|uniref:VanW family protein n=1 Tax=Amycolatopsis sp. BJA-103 TaxID=1911175 RepID=UPI000C78A1EF|nr:VanW family protein [Amycolatopsis sp. BJA-103]AUI62519.1 vanomycin resistance protein VanB [Amycolatopsis sp. BJA-103]PNE18356.1 vanomycin resistance protein VanB [Amycolatopsis sp. BJA-103]
MARDDHDEPGTDLFTDELLPSPETDEDLVDELFEGDRVVHPPPTPASKFRKGLGKAFMTAGLLMGLFVLAYAVDLIVSAGDVPRGVTVAGIDVGGLTHKDAESKLRRELEPKLIEPVRIRAGDVRTVLYPTSSGLGLDWPQTLGRAGHQPLSPYTRVMSFFTSREVGVVTWTDAPKLERAVTDLAAAKLNRPPVEGNIAFQPVAGSDGGVLPVAVEPRSGQTLADPKAAVTAVTDGWLSDGGVELKVTVAPVKANSPGVHAALAKIVVPAVAKPLVIRGEGKDATLKPDTIAGSFQFAARDDGNLEVRIDQGKLRAAAQPQLKETETDGADAQIVFVGDRPAVQPSKDARKVNWDLTFTALTTVLGKSDERELKAVYDASSPAVSTDAANVLGINEVIGEFTTSGLSGPSMTNTQTLATRVSGTIVKPNETFSLGARSGPRTAAAGYVPAPANEDGTGPVVVGGGVSQLATTLYNAAYLAGLADGGHLEHDNYLDRYPVARDVKAINNDGSPVEMQIVNDAPTGIAIQVIPANGSVTVRIWGTKRFSVQSVGGERHSYVPQPVQVGSGPGCVPDPGAAGFSTSDTRVLVDVVTGTEVRRETRNATYSPRITILCT